MLRHHGITRELVVRLERNLPAESLSYLNNQPINPQQGITRRRASVASASLFAIGSNVREAGFDYFARIPRSNQVMINSASTNDQEPIASTSDQPSDQLTDATVSISTDAQRMPIDQQDEGDYETSDILEPVELSPLHERDEDSFGGEQANVSNGTDPFGEDVETLYYDEDEITEQNNEREVVDDVATVECEFIDDIDDENLYIDQLFNEETDETDPFGEHIETLYYDEDDLIEQNSENNEDDVIDCAATVDGDPNDDIENLYLDQFFIEETEETNEVVIALAIEPLKHNEDGIDGRPAVEFVDPKIQLVEQNEDDDDGGPTFETIDSNTVATANNSSNGSQEMARRVLHNDFQPFHRLPNVPFRLSGRPRAMSVDWNFSPASAEPNTQPAQAVAQSEQPVPQPEEPVAQPEQPIAQPARVLQRRPSTLAVPKLETIAEEDEDTLAFLSTLFRE